MIGIGLRMLLLNNGNAPPIGVWSMPCLRTVSTTHATPCRSLKTETCFT